MRKEDEILVVLGAVVTGVLVGLVPGYISDLTARANHDDFAVGVAVVYDVAPSKAQQVEDCQALVDALPNANVQCVRVR